MSYKKILKFITPLLKIINLFCINKEYFFQKIFIKKKLKFLLKININFLK